MSDSFEQFVWYCNTEYFHREGEEKFSPEELKRLRSIYDKIKQTDLERFDKDVPRVARELRDLQRGKFK